jgi:hypothetical protein
MILRVPGPASTVVSVEEWEERLSLSQGAAFCNRSLCFTSQADWWGWVADGQGVFQDSGKADQHRLRRGSYLGTAQGAGTSSTSNLMGVLIGCVFRSSGQASDTPHTGDSGIC